MQLATYPLPCCPAALCGWNVLKVIFVEVFRISEFIQRRLLNKSCAFCRSNGAKNKKKSLFNCFKMCGWVCVSAWTSLWAFPGGVEQSGARRSPSVSYVCAFLFAHIIYACVAFGWAPEQRWQKVKTWQSSIYDFQFPLILPFFPLSPHSR